MRLMPWVALAAFVAWIGSWMVLSPGEPTTGDHWTRRYPFETSVGAGLLVLVVGCLIVIAVNSERAPRRRPDA